MFAAFDGLLACDAVGRRDECWPVFWDTTDLENGQYEIMGLMHVFVRTNGEEKAIARENIVEVVVEN